MAGIKISWLKRFIGWLAGKLGLNLLASISQRGWLAGLYWLA